MPKPENGLEQGIVNNLKGEFIQDTLERLDALDEILDGLALSRISDAEVLSSIRREAHSIKGMGGSFGFPVISNMAHRMEDYLAEVAVVDDRILDNVSLYITAMRDVVQAGEEPAPEDADRLLKSLPSPWMSEDRSAGGNRTREWEVLLGLENAVLRSVVGRELAGHGCRALTASSPFEIIQMAATLNPDAIIMTTVMDGIWGADVTRALNAISVTRDIPVALLTSLDERKLGVLPEPTILIHEDRAALTRGLAMLCERIMARDRDRGQNLTYMHKKAAI